MALTKIDEAVAAVRKAREEAIETVKRQTVADAVREFEAFVAYQEQSADGFNVVDARNFMQNLIVRVTNAAVSETLRTVG